MKDLNAVVRWAAVFFAVVNILMFFLPYVSTIGDTRNFYTVFWDTMASERYGITCGEARDLSLFECEKLYLRGGSERDVGYGHESAGFLQVVLVGAVGMLSVLTLVFVWKDKPILAMILIALEAVVLEIVNTDMADRVLDTYNGGIGWGTAHFLYLAPVIGVLGMGVLRWEEQKKQAAAPVYAQPNAVPPRQQQPYGQPYAAPARPADVTRTAVQRAGCPACEQNRRAGRRFCPQCGTRLSS